MTATALPLNTPPSLGGRIAGRLRDVTVLTTRNFIHIAREPPPV